MFHSHRNSLVHLVTRLDRRSSRLDAREPTSATRRRCREFRAVATRALAGDRWSESCTTSPPMLRGNVLVVAAAAALLVAACSMPDIGGSNLAGEKEKGNGDGTSAPNS